jgi:hypothetical protein
MIFIIKDLHIALTFPLILYRNNLGALHMTINSVFHVCSKHIKLDYHFMRERNALSFLSLNTSLLMIK